MLVSGALTDAKLACAQVLASLSAETGHTPGEVLYAHLDTEWEMRLAQGGYRGWRREGKRKKRLIIRVQVV